jgi:hypothetical protein
VRGHGRNQSATGRPEKSNGARNGGRCGRVRVGAGRCGGGIDWDVRARRGAPIGVDGRAGTIACKCSLLVQGVECKREQ